VRFYLLIFMYLFIPLLSYVVTQNKCTLLENATLAAVNMAFQVSGFNQDAFENAT